MVLPTSPLQIVPSELEWVQVDLHTGVVDHVLGDRHRGGSSERPERSVARSVRLANLAVDAEAGELIALVQSTMVMIMMMLLVMKMLTWETRSCCPTGPWRWPSRQARRPSPNRRSCTACSRLL